MPIGVAPKLPTALEPGDLWAIVAAVALLALLVSCTLDRNIGGTLPLLFLSCGPLPRCLSFCFALRDSFGRFAGLGERAVELVIADALRLASFVAYLLLGPVRSPALCRPGVDALFVFDLRWLDGLGVTLDRLLPLGFPAGLGLRWRCLVAATLGRFGEPLP
jgi:hypothetical protein